MTRQQMSTALAGLVLVVLPLACGEKPTAKGASGDVEVEILGAAPRRVTGFDIGDHPRDLGMALVVKLKFVNRSESRAIETDNLQDGSPGASLSDEHGKSYASLGVPSGFRFAADNWPRLPGIEEDPSCSRKKAIARHLTIEPGQCCVTHLFFEKPADNATQVRLRIAAGAIEEGSAALILQAPLQR
jgi:hypothetical protein